MSREASCIALMKCVHNKKNAPNEVFANWKFECLSALVDGWRFYFFNGSKPPMEKTPWKTAGSFVLAPVSEPNACQSIGWNARCGFGGFGGMLLALTKI